MSILLTCLVSAPWAWTVLTATGHRHDLADAPAADVVLVLGTAVAPDGLPENRLEGRLATAAELVKSGRARVVLVSGDGNGDSGDEPAAMTSYLTEHLGVDPARVVADPSGLDTYDSCIRARDVYDVRTALVVTQPYHLSRAVTLCRTLGIDTEGVEARCDNCGTALMMVKQAREYVACSKAAWDVITRRDPYVGSPASPEVTDALQS
ncbi:SanA/YdcF family protein [Kineosporia succinea]|uniref:Vancomycin permeability regulator SanA n=1 Tax=Kineosporia succinea TaxID=84632 RepID=A0ABT9P9Y9_9ACTN|nr:ElyC/SanA/YdcF family protein [Kineosporia succinea]MDP9829510.1 vancomycin permeability regulator SanA [Kineosporia succinea]